MYQGQLNLFDYIHNIPLSCWNILRHLLVHKTHKVISPLFLKTSCFRKTTFESPIDNITRKNHKVISQGRGVGRGDSLQSVGGVLVTSCGSAHRFYLAGIGKHVPPHGIELFQRRKLNRMRRAFRPDREINPKEDISINMLWYTYWGYTCK